MTELQDTLDKMRTAATEVEVIRNDVHLKHRIADLLYGDTDEGELNLEVDKDIFFKVLKDIEDGQQIFKTPEISGDPCDASPASISLGRSRQTYIASRMRDILEKPKSEFPIESFYTKNKENTP